MTMLVEETKKDIINKLNLKEWLTDEIAGDLEYDGEIYDGGKLEYRVDSIFEMIFEDYLDDHYNEIIDSDVQYANLIDASVYLLALSIYNDLENDCYDKAIEECKEARDFEEVRSEALKGNY